MRIGILAASLIAIVIAGPASGQERFLEEIKVDYDVSVRCSGVYGAAATGMAMEHFEHHPYVATYRRYERQFARYTQRFGPQLRISDPSTEDAVSDARGEAFRPVREALFAQDEPGFRAALTGLYSLIPECEEERVRLSQGFGIPPDVD